MGLGLEDKIAECFTATVGIAYRTRDTRVIERDGWHQVITPSSREPSKNEVTFSVLADEADAVITETIAQYRPQGLPLKWCVGPLTRPLDFGARLERHGFAHSNIRGMICDPSRLRLSSPEAIAVDRVTHETVDEYARAAVAGWADQPSSSNSDWKLLAEDYRWALEQPGERYQFFLARMHGEPVGTAGLVLKPQSAYLMGGNVLPNFRGAGIYRALIEARLEALRRLGARLATTQAREATSAPILEKLGFETLFHSRLYLLPAP